MNREQAPTEARLQETKTTSCVAIDPASSDSEKCLRISLVDDDLSFLEVSKQVLSMQNNFKIDTATSVGEVRKKWKNKLTMRWFRLRNTSKSARA